ncbi:PDGLE domain-containing protein [Desulfallas sp. Bu1-1]|jgi:cobalt/nickel transport protein|uniref:PDGLE domain-containing protein n=1 Tax=Desulfallas sp. Bu1-1 TaxID=2787620 RepID=UPI0018A10DD3|nr:PDGLE domain-containing protein [Desulfallas sp. Bu1-1]MBF7082037.1 PDGLE domain-containing protein [Desulfallas sp. Bu1-1]
MGNLAKVFIAALIVAACLSPFASPHPDGLERVAEDKGFLEKGEGKEVITSPIPDYLFPGIGNESLATSAAGVVGTLLTFGVMYGLAKAVGKKNSQTG